MSPDLAGSSWEHRRHFSRQLRYTGAELSNRDVWRLDDAVWQGARPEGCRCEKQILTRSNVQVIVAAVVFTALRRMHYLDATELSKII